MTKAETDFKQSDVIKYLLENPELIEEPNQKCNSILYDRFNATTNSQKVSIRKAKAEVLKQSQSQDIAKPRAKKIKSEKPIVTKEERRPDQNNLPAIPDDFMTLWKEDKDVLKAMIAKYKQTTSINFVLSEQDFEPEKPFKTYSYSLSQKLHEDFEGICKELKVSKRKGIHLALKGFIDFYDKK